MKRSQAMAFIRRQTGRFIPGIILRSLINVITSLTLLSFALFSGNVIDISAGQKTGDLRANILLLFVSILVFTLLSALNMHLSATMQGRIKITLQKSLFTSFTLKRFSETSKYHSGDILNRMTDDVDAVTGGVASIIPALVSFVTKIAAGFIALFVLKPEFAVICVVGCLLIPAVGRLISSKYRFLHKEVQRTNGVTRSFLQECFVNMPVVKSFANPAPLQNKLDDCLKDNYRVKIKRNWLSIFSSVGLYTAFTVGYYAVLVWGAASISKGEMTYGILIAILQIMTQLRAPMQNISGILPEYYAMTASAERLMEFDSLEDEEPPLPEQEIEALRASFDSLKAESLRFCYDENEVIRDSAFTVKRGDVVAITGRSGAGKTTLFRLFLGLNRPAGGSLTFNGEIPISAAHRAMFAYVPQGNMILSGTIRENIAFGREKIGEQDLIRAAKAAEIYDYIVSLPDGFDTLLAERGAGLSEGQIQRIAIARAIAADAPILLLDECSSALDEQTEQAVMKNLSAMTDKTVLFITHRDSVLASCNKRLVIEDGVYHIS